MDQQTNSLREGFVLRGNHDYTIKATINRGGFGITYRAEAEYMDDHIPQTGIYAIKELFPNKLCHRAADQSVTPDEAREEIFRKAYEEFKAEADCLYNLHHKGIVPVNEVMETNGTVYYVMKYLDGKTLKDYVSNRGGRLPQDEAVAITKKVGEALSYLHRNNILHLDVKPGNIMMVGAQPVLIDFGSFRKYKANGQLTTEKVDCFSNGFSPLEQYDGIATFSPKADVYALGATLYYMLTGEVPVEAKEISKKWIYTTVPDELSDNVVDALSNAMSKTPADRTESVSKFVSALLGQVADEEGKHHTRVVERVSPQKKAPQKKWFWAGTLAAVVLAAIAAFFLLRPTTLPPEGEQEGQEEKAVKETTSNAPTTSNEKEEGQTTVTPQQQEAPSDTRQPSTQQSATTPTASQQPVATPTPTKQEKTEKAAPQPEPAKVEKTEKTEKAKPTSGRLDLGYAEWEGGIANGQPDGKGTMTFKSSHVIESRDINHKTASPGDRVSGTYSQGHLVWGTWTKSNGEKEKLNIGK